MDPGSHDGRRAVGRTAKATNLRAMAQQKREGLTDELREAVERTFSAVAGSAAGTRERAQELLDEAVRLGSVARETVEKEIDSLRKRIGELESSLGRSKPGE